MLARFRRRIAPPVRCECICHAPGSTVVHVMACCVICPRCGVGFTAGLERHEKHCTGTARPHRAS